MGKKYIDNLAESIMGQLDITLSNIKEKSGNLEREGIGVISRLYAAGIETILLNMKPEKWGRIAIHGRSVKNASSGETSLLHANCNRPFDPSDGGKDVLFQLAYFTIVAEVFDILKAKAAKMTEKPVDDPIDHQPKPLYSDGQKVEGWDPDEEYILYIQGDPTWDEDEKTFMYQASENPDGTGKLVTYSESFFSLPGESTFSPPKK